MTNSEPTHRIPCDAATLLLIRRIARSTGRTVQTTARDLVHDMAKWLAKANALTDEEDL